MFIFLPMAAASASAAPADSRLVLLAVGLLASALPHEAAGRASLAVPCGAMRGDGRAQDPAPPRSRLRLRGGAGEAGAEAGGGAGGAGPAAGAGSGAMPEGAGARADGGVNGGGLGEPAPAVPRTREAVGARHAAPLRVAPEPGDIIVGHTDSCRTASLAEAVWDLCFGMPEWEEDSGPGKDEVPAERGRERRIYVRTGQQTWSGAMTIPSGACACFRLRGPAPRTLSRALLSSWSGALRSEGAPPAGAVRPRPPERETQIAPR